MTRLVPQKGARTTAVVMVLAILAVGSILIFSAPAAAAPMSSDPPVATNSVYDPLERLFQRERRLLEHQEKRLQNATAMVTRIQNRIDVLTAEGKETAELDSALVGHTAAVAKAQIHFDAAKSAVDAHEGFDSNGDVTHRAQARQTVISVGKAERDFHRTMERAVRELRKAAREYIQTHKSPLP